MEQAEVEEPQDPAELAGGGDLVPSSKLQYFNSKNWRETITMDITSQRDRIVHNSSNK